MFFYLFFSTFLKDDKDAAEVETAYVDESELDALLKKLNDGSTSPSADLIPPKTSFTATKISTSGTDSEQMLPKRATTAKKNSRPKKKKAYKGPSTLGLGFDPTAVEPESGFKPIVSGQGSNMPTLAFSVLDGVDRPPVSPAIYQDDMMRKQQEDFLIEQLMQAQDRSYQVTVSKIEYILYLKLRFQKSNFFQDKASSSSALDSGIDRGGVKVNVPAPVVPYVPPVSKAQHNYNVMGTDRILKHDEPMAATVTLKPRNYSNSPTKATAFIGPVKGSGLSESSADFSAFATTEKDTFDEDYVYDAGYQEEDRIDVQQPMPTMIDPNALIYSQQSAPYGHQFPSYIPDTIQTLVGTLGTSDSSKTFSTDKHVIYGKFPEGPNASENLNVGLPKNVDSEDDYYYYDDSFEYAPGEYYYDDEYDKDSDYTGAISNADGSASVEQLQMLKKRLGMVNGEEDDGSKKVSFLQLLKNLQGNSNK